MPSLTLVLAEFFGVFVSFPLILTCFLGEGVLLLWVFSWLEFCLVPGPDDFLSPFLLAFGSGILTVKPGSLLTGSLGVSVASASFGRSSFAVKDSISIPWSNSGLLLRSSAANPRLSETGATGLLICLLAVLVWPLKCELRELLFELAAGAIWLPRIPSSPTVLAGDGLGFVFVAGGVDGWFSAFTKWFKSQFLPLAG